MTHSADAPQSLATGQERSPRRLVLVRHGQSLGNIAAEAASAAGEGRITLDTRDPDTELSDDGRSQATALGQHLATLTGDALPDVVVASPYARARQTAEVALQAAGLEHALVFDERLRERDMGIFDGFTGQGIREKYPEEAERRAFMGKFYYRPPGGEAWTDVALRIRSLMADLRTHYDDKTVWVFSHQAVIMSFRFVLERLDEKTVLGIDAKEPLPNCSMTSYVRGDGGELVLDRYADVDYLDGSDAPVTRESPAVQEPPR